MKSSTLMQSLNFGFPIKNFSHEFDGFNCYIITKVECSDFYSIKIENDLIDQNKLDDAEKFQCFTENFDLNGLSFILQKLVNELNAIDTFSLTINNQTNLSAILIPDGIIDMLVNYRYENQIKNIGICSNNFSVLNEAINSRFIDTITIKVDRKIPTNEYIELMNLAFQRNILVQLEVSKKYTEFLNSLQDSFQSIESDKINAIILS